METLRPSEPAASEARQRAKRATRRHQVVCAVGLVGPFLGVFVMMKSLLLGLLVLVVSVWIGSRFAFRP